MKFSVTFKDPDTLSDAIADAVKADVARIEDIGDLERLDVTERRCVDVRRRVSRWFEHGEYVTIDLDTEAGTATVRPK